MPSSRASELSGGLGAHFAAANPSGLEKQGSAGGAGGRRLGRVGPEARWVRRGGREGGWGMGNKHQYERPSIPRVATGRSATADGRTLAPPWWCGGLASGSFARSIAFREDS